MIKTSLIILIIWTFFQGFFSQFQGIIPRNVDLLDEFILLGLTFYWVGRILLGKAKFKRTPFDFILLILVVYVILASLINSYSPFISLLAIRDTFQYVLLFYILVQLDIKEKDLLFLFKIIFIIAIFQFFVIMIQLGSHFFKTGSLFLEDFANGTFGSHSSHKLGYFMGMMIITSLVLYLSKKERKYLISTLLFCIILVITHCRGAYFVTGGTLLFLYKGYILKSIKSFSTVLFILIFLGLLIFYFNKISSEGTGMIDPKTVFSQQLGLKPGTGRRIGLMFYCFNLLKNSDYPLLGVSPGRLGKTSMYFGKSWVIEEIEYLSKGTEYTLILNQLGATVVEYGVVGSIIIFLVFLKVYSIDRRILKKERNQYKNNFKNYLSFILKGVFLIYFFGIFTEKIFEIQEISLYFWFLFSLLYLLEKKSIIEIQMPNDQMSLRTTGGSVTIS